MPAALKIDWESARRAAETGAPLRVVAESFGASFDAVRQRSLRERWLIPSRVETLRREQKARVSQSVAASPAGEVSAATLAAMGQELKITTLQKTLHAIKRTDLASLPIDSWQDAKTAFDIGLKAAGMDSPSGPSVSVIVSGAPDSAPLIEIDAAPVPELL
jgi:hypothetical protein